MEKKKCREKCKEELRNDRCEEAEMPLFLSSSESEFSRRQNFASLYGKLQKKERDYLPARPFRLPDSLFTKGHGVDQWRPSRKPYAPDFNMKEAQSREFL
ncbi:hypothetical protein OCU04_008874 [Sclerotinia nivalis]|uniref:Uncharacterized protein n=1 Tax=Sclerotinia nivalis TaxID=352851 RepID=A0A9X0DG66_9HELO|nr:hypothetical protein OCU04_008874 [Sclerotinia nivalis]